MTCQRIQRGDADTSNQRGQFERLSCGWAPGRCESGLLWLTLTLGQEYEFQELVGSGAYAQVWRASSRHREETVAIKKIGKARLRPNSRQRRNVQREVSIMKQLTHPNVIKLFGVWETKTEVILVMEYAAGGMLFTEIAENHTYGYAEGSARGLVGTIIQVLVYMHQHVSGALLLAGCGSP